MGDRINAQTMYGTIGLLHAPTAEMQRDKIVMEDGNVLHLTPLHDFSFTQCYFADTKYVTFKNISTLGVHVSFIWDREFRVEHKNSPAGGLNFRPNLPTLVARIPFGKTTST